MGFSASITGLASPGETLNAAIVNSNTNDVYSYQWQSSADGTFDDAVNIGSGETYQVGAGDIGSVIQVLVTATDRTTAETSSATSLPTAAVVPFEFTNAAGGDWGVVSNWSLGAVPGANDDAIISAPGATVTVSGEAANEINVDANTTLAVNGALTLGGGMASLQNDGALGSENLGVITVNTGGDLSLNTLLNNPGTINVDGGTLSDAGGVQLNGFGQLNVDGGSVEGGLTLNGNNALFTNGATVAGAITIENGSNLVIGGSTDLANDVTLNNGNLYFGAAAEISSTLDTDQGGTSNAADTPDLNWTVSGAALPTAEQSGVAAAAMDQIVVNNAIAWQHDTSTAGWIAAPGWTIDASNQATGQPVASATTPYTFTTKFTAANADEVLAGFFQADDTGLLSLNGNAIVTDNWYNGPQAFLLDAADGLVAGTNTLSIEMTAADGLNDGAFVQMVAPVTIDTGVTVQGQGYIGDNYNGTNGPAIVINQGVIDANVENGTLTVAPTGFFNEGTVEATNGASLYVGAGYWTNEADGTVSATGSQLLLDGTVTNLGEIETTNSDVYFNGVDTLADLGNESYSAETGNVYTNFTNTDPSELVLFGTINLNPGDTLDATQGFFDNLTLVGNAYINGGTVVTSAAPGGATGELNIAANSDANLQNVTIDNAGTWTISETTLVIGGSNLLQGEGVVTLDPNGVQASIVSDGQDTSTLENYDNTIQGAGVIGDGYLSIQNDGTGANGEAAPATIDANVDGETLTVAPDGLLNNDGLLEATNGGILVIGGANEAQGWTNEGDGVITAINATLALAGSAANPWTNFGSISASGSQIDLQGYTDFASQALTITDNGGNQVVVNGTLELDQDTLDTTQGLFANLTLNGGTIQDGAIIDGAVGTLGFSNNTGNTLENVTVQGPLVVNGGFVSLVNDTLDGGLVVENGGVVQLDNNTQILDSTGSVPGPVTLDNGTIEDGTLNLSGGFTLGGGGGTLHDVTVTNPGLLTINNNQALIFDGTLDNSGTLAMNASGGGYYDTSYLYVGADGLTLDGAGAVTMNNSSCEGSAILSNGAATTLTNFDNTI